MRTFQCVYTRGRRRPATDIRAGMVQKVIQVERHTPWSHWQCACIGVCCREGMAVQLVRYDPVICVHLGLNVRQAIRQSECGPPSLSNRSMSSIPTSRPAPAICSLWRGPRSCKPSISAVKTHPCNGSTSRLGLHQTPLRPSQERPTSSSTAIPSTNVGPLTSTRTTRAAGRRPLRSSQCSRISPSP